MTFFFSTCSFFCALDSAGFSMNAATCGLCGAMKMLNGPLFSRLPLFSPARQPPPQRPHPRRRHPLHPRHHQHPLQEPLPLIHNHPPFSVASTTPLRRVDTFEQSSNSIRASNTRRVRVPQRRTYSVDFHWNHLMRFSELRSIPIPAVSRPRLSQRSSLNFPSRKSSFKSCFVARRGFWRNLLQVCQIRYFDAHVMVQPPS